MNAGSGKSDNKGLGKRARSFFIAAGIGDAGVVGGGNIMGRR